MAYGHAERNLALLRQLEAETRQLLESLDQPDPEQSGWLQRPPAEERTDEAGMAGRASRACGRGHEREQKPAAVPQNQVLNPNGRWWQVPGKPVKPRPDAFSDDCPE
jgi:hypothetical protein